MRIRRALKEELEDVALFLIGALKPFLLIGTLLAALNGLFWLLG